MHKKYVNESHEWMDIHVLKGAYPDLYGYLMFVDHNIPASRIWDQLKLWTERYLNAESNRSHLFHLLLDAELDRQIKIDIQNGFIPPFCHKGCANCCYQPVACTNEEAELIYSYCSLHKIPINFDKLQRQQNALDFDSDANFVCAPHWDAQPQEDQSCVFLDTDSKSCLIWEVRPFVCRSHLAEKTNEFCRGKNGVPDPRARGIHYEESSYILSSVFTVHHDSVGKMMGALLSALRS